MAYLVGPALVHYGDEDKVETTDLSKYIDRSKKIVTSNTGEITMNYGDGIATINAPQAQGATGFLGKQGTIELDDISITSKDHYVTVMVVSVDEKPLAKSSKVFLQVTTRARPHGWKESDGHRYKTKDESFTGKRIDNVGGAPWNVVKTEGLKVSIKNTRLKTATVLDANLYATSTTADTKKKAKC